MALYDSTSGWTRRFYHLQTARHLRVRPGLLRLRQDGAATYITLACSAHPRVGDIVTFTEEDGGNLDSNLSLERLVGHWVGAITAGP